MMKKLNFLANWIIRIVGVGIFTILTWYACFYTQYMLPLEGYEYPIDEKDSLIINLLTILLFFLICFGGRKLEDKLSEKMQNRVKRIVLWVAMSAQGVGGYLWIAAADRCPKGDQESIYHSAVQFLNGEYQALNRGSYCGLYPHQLGLVSFEKCMFQLFGTTDYHVVQFIFVLMVVGTCYVTYRMLGELTEHVSTVVLGMLLEGMCLLPIFYSCWLYGEVPYVFFAMLAAWMLLIFCKKEKWRYLVAFGAATTMAVLVRKNALILLVAFALVAGVYALCKKKYGVLAAIMLVLLIPNLCYEGIFKIYELRSGIPHSEGLPSNDFVYIGLVETEGERYGWDFYPSTQIYYDCDKNPEATKIAVNRLIAERWLEMKKEPGYFVKFFKGKMLSQWNAPLYQAMYFNYVHEDVHMPRITTFLDKLSGEYYEAILWGADRMQMIVYLGMLLYFGLAVKKDSDILQHLLAVTIIGGFFFSLMWEAKTRYIFPYYMMMFPLAAIGYENFLDFFQRFFQRYCRKH